MKSQKEFNRLILIGNGFDLMHNLETRYSDFLKSYLMHCVTTFFIKETYEDELLEIKYTDSYRPSPLPDYTKEDILSFFDDLETAFNSLVKIKVNFVSPFFKKIHNKLKFGWVDIEKEYYLMLIDYYQYHINKNIKVDLLGDVKKLNNDLQIISGLLRSYLMEEQEKYNVKSSINRSNFRVAFQDFEQNDFPQFSITGKNKVNKVFFLNFNYTEPVFYDHLASSEEYEWDCVNIHGTLNDNMIFGYGDELDDYYKQIEKLGDDEWLRGFKSFGYLQNHSYNGLLGFLEEREFQVFVVGHSCGLSDKTLLNQIFEHKHCKNIKVFYHKYTEGERKGEDTFNETIYNISRIMGDKVKLRNIVSKKTNSQELKSLYSLAPVKK